MPGADRPSYAVTVELVASDQVVVPVSPDLFSLQGLRNLGPTLREWRNGWRKRLGELGNPDRPLPVGNMTPLGYVVLGHGVRLDRPVQAYQRWIAQIPDEFHGAVPARRRLRLFLIPTASLNSSITTA